MASGKCGFNGPTPSRGVAVAATERTAGLSGACGRRGMREITDFDILTLPGWHNSGPDHWQSHWEQAFPTMRRVVQDDWDAPVYADWSRRLSEEVERCARPVLLI